MLVVKLKILCPLLLLIFLPDSNPYQSGLFSLNPVIQGKIVLYFLFVFVLFRQGSSQLFFFQWILTADVPGRCFGFSHRQKNWKCLLDRCLQSTVCFHFGTVVQWDDSQPRSRTVESSQYQLLFRWPALSRTCGQSYQCTLIMNYNGSVALSKVLPAQLTLEL